jgi:hypothetical protein
MRVQQVFTVMMLLRMQRKTCAPQATIALLVRAQQRQTFVLLVRSLLAAQITWVQQHAEYVLRAIARRLEVELRLQIHVMQVRIAR